MRKLCQPTAFILKLHLFPTSPVFWLTRDFGLEGPHNHMSQFLTLDLPIICIWTPYWFCFSEEPGLIEPPTVYLQFSHQNDLLKAKSEPVHAPLTTPQYIPLLLREKAMLLTKASAWFVHIVLPWSNLLPLLSLFCCSHTGFPAVLWGSDDWHLLFPCLEHSFPRILYGSLHLLQVVVTFSRNSSLVALRQLSLSFSGRLLFLCTLFTPNMLCNLLISCGPSCHHHHGSWWRQGSFVPSFLDALRKYWTNKLMDEYFVLALEKITLLKKFFKSLHLNKTKQDNKDQPWTFSSVPFSILCP